MGKKIKFGLFITVSLMAVFGIQLLGNNVYAAEGDEDKCASIYYSRDKNGSFSKATVCQKADGSLYNPYQNDYANQSIPHFEIENDNVRKICFVLPNGRGPGGDSRGCQSFADGKEIGNNSVLLAAVDSTYGCKSDGVTFTCTSQNNSGDVAWYVRHQEEQVISPIEKQSGESTEDERGTCASIYYSNSRNEGQGKSIAAVCQKSDGSVYVLSPNNYGPHFVVDDKLKKLCFVIPGYQSISEDKEGCTFYTTVPEITNNSLLILAVKNNDSCSVNGNTAECAFKDKTGSGLWYVDLTETTARKPGESLVDPEMVGEETPDSEDCMSSGAGSSMGWILCPILELVSGTTEFLYNDFVEPALMVKPALFTQDNSEGGTRYAWGVFQGIANLLFIIILLVVIVSQLTGYGIDNYGIKKILPKLIVAAILINLSYYICLICIDISNIVGNGLQSFFESLPVFKEEESVSLLVGVEEIVVGNIKSGLVSVGLLGALVAQVGPLFLAGGWAGILLALLGAAISVFVAIFFTFLLLAAREAAIVVLTVISPLAFACFVLPNTKYLFDKWWKAGKALLLLYPICGLLIGGGNYVSKLLLSTDMANSFFTALTAMLVGIVPLFFVPSLLKNSLAMFGNIGAKMSGFGQRLGGRLRSGAENTVKGTEAYKNYQADFGRQRRINAATRTVNRLEGYRQRTGRLTERQQRTLMQAQSVVVGEEEEQLKRNSWLNEGGLEAERAGIAARAHDRNVQNRLTLMKSNDREHGGIMVGGQRVEFNRDNAVARVRELELASQNEQLNDNQRIELAALAHGLSEMSGGASRLNDIIRGEQRLGTQQNPAHYPNDHFMEAMGEIYSQDSTVQSAMNTKDGTIGAYMEGWTNGGRYTRPGAQAETYGDYSTNHLQSRIQSYEAGLKQGGQALEDYINGLTAEQCQEIYDQGLEKLLDAHAGTGGTSDLERFKRHARTLPNPVLGRSAQNVNIVNVPHTPNNPGP